MNDSREKIERFIAAFGYELQSIKDLFESNTSKIQKQVLCCAYIDALSAIAYPSEGGRARFVKTVQVYGSWDYGKYVSIPHLFKLLSLNSDENHHELNTFLNDRISQWSTGDCIGLENDIRINDLENQFCINVNDKIKNIKTVNLSHENLLYTYRCSLVHEYSTLGSSLEIADDSNPYYLAIITSSGDLPFYWSLIYPTGFLFKLCETVFANLKAHIVETKQNPFENVKINRYWLKGLE